MKLNSFSLAAAVLVLLFGGIGFSTVMNWWQTENTLVPAVFTEGVAAGQYNPADIRGSYSFGDVSELFGVPLADLKIAFRLPDDQDPASFPLKTLETISEGLPVEVGTSSVRLFVAFYLGLPYDLVTNEEAFLFPEAAEILKTQNILTDEQNLYLSSHLVDFAPAEPEETKTPVSEITAIPAPTEHIAPEMTITGQTTFQDVLDWGVPQEVIENILGKPLPNTQSIIKDYVVELGLLFSEVKTRLQSEVDLLN